MNAGDRTYQAGEFIPSLQPGFSPSAIFYYCVLAKQGESLVHFDYVLDMIGCGYQLAVDFAHAPPQLMLTQHFSLANMERLLVNS